MFDDSFYILKWLAQIDSNLKNWSRHLLTLDCHHYRSQTSWYSWVLDISFSFLICTFKDSIKLTTCFVKKIASSLYSTSCVTFVTIKMLLFTDRQLNLDDWLFLWLKCRGVFNHLAFCSLWFQTYVKLCPKYILQDVSFMAAFKFLSRE